MAEVLFQVGPLTFRTFNLLAALGFALSMLFLMRFILRNKLSASFLSVHLLVLLLLAFLGGRLFYGIENSAYFLKNLLDFLAVWDLKLSAFGIFYTGILSLFFFCRKARENFWSWLDAVVLTGMLGLIFIHLGHFFDGDFYGKPTDLPWGIVIDSPAIPFTTPIHPTQLYSALVSVALFLLGLKRSRRTHLSGVVGTAGIMLYSLCALGIDFLHGVPSFYAQMNFGIIATVSFILLIHCSHKIYQAS